jgi:large subunit ribosomal protein L4
MAQRLTKVVDMQNAGTGEIALDDTVFGAVVKPHLVHDVVRMQLAKRRQGTASTRTRSEVRGGGKKPWKQKGTGRARAGTRRSPLWRGGGTIFGPKPRNYAYSIPRRVRTAAVRAALSSKVREGQLIVLENLSQERPNTKEFKALLERLRVTGRVLIVIDQTKGNDAVAMSCRNLSDVMLVPVQGLNVYDLLRHETVVMTRAALSMVEEAWKP